MAEHSSPILGRVTWFASKLHHAPATLGTLIPGLMPSGGLSTCLYLRSGGLAAMYAPVFEYDFGDRGAPHVRPDPGFELGAVDAAELPYQFPHISHTYKVDGPVFSPAANRIAGKLLAYWSRFAHSGTPHAAAWSRWPKYSGEASVIQFAAGDVRLFEANTAHHCAFWQTLYPDVLRR